MSSEVPVKQSSFILDMQGITKTFPGVKALDNVSFSVRPAEVHALVGENGAGKSTLMKILNGVWKADSGSILIDGRPVKFNGTKDAQSKGISLIYQEFNLVNTLSVAENIYLGYLQTGKAGFIRWKEVRDDAAGLINRLGFDFSVNEKVQNLSVAEKQLVEIAKALSVNARIIAMDEPTSSLTNTEIDKLFEIVHGLRVSGITVVYISHKLEEVFAICDTVTVLRDGRIIDTKPVIETTTKEIISKMVGRPVELNFPSRPMVVKKETVLDVRNLNCAGFVKNISFKLNRGEVLGIAGLVGSGRTELVEAIFGARPLQGGELFMDNRRLIIRNTADGKKCSIGLVTEDRKETGLALHYSVNDNIVITNLSKVSKKGFVSRKMSRAEVNRYIKDLGIKTPSIRQSAINLSGGNQQKVVLAKWLFSDVEILILDEPTRGIDVGAKYEIYLLMNRLVEQGKSIIMISSELPEVIGMSDRVIVINAGLKKGELEGEAITAEAIMHMALT